MQSSIENGIDIEDKNRFYKNRDIMNEPQSFWIFKIFKLSMNSSVQATGIIVSIFASISFLIQLVSVQLFADVIPILEQIKALKVLHDTLPIADPMIKVHNLQI